MALFFAPAAAPVSPSPPPSPAHVVLSARSPLNDSINTNQHLHLSSEFSSEGEKSSSSLSSPLLGSQYGSFPSSSNLLQQRQQQQQALKHQHHRASDGIYPAIYCGSTGSAVGGASITRTLDELPTTQVVQARGSAFDMFDSHALAYQLANGNNTALASSEIVHPMDKTIHFPHTLDAILEKRSHSTLGNSSRLSSRQQRSVASYLSRRMSTDVLQGLVASKHGKHAHSFSLSDLSLFRAFSRLRSPSRSSTSSVQSSPAPSVLPAVPVHDPPLRCSTPEGLPTFNTMKAVNYQLPRPRSLHNYRAKSLRKLFRSRRDVHAARAEWRYQTKNLPPGAVMRGRDGTLVRGRWKPTQSGHTAIKRVPFAPSVASVSAVTAESISGAGTHWPIFAPPNNLTDTAAVPQDPSTTARHPSPIRIPPRRRRSNTSSTGWDSPVRHHSPVRAESQNGSAKANNDTRPLVTDCTNGPSINQSDVTSSAPVPPEQFIASESPIKMPSPLRIPSRRIRRFAQGASPSHAHNASSAPASGPLEPLQPASSSNHGFRLPSFHIPARRMVRKVETRPRAISMVEANSAREAPIRTIDFAYYPARKKHYSENMHGAMGMQHIHERPSYILHRPTASADAAVPEHLTSFLYGIGDYMLSQRDGAAAVAIGHVGPGAGIQPTSTGTGLSTSIPVIQPSTMEIPPATVPNTAVSVPVTAPAHQRGPSYASPLSQSSDPIRSRESQHIPVIPQTPTQPILNEAPSRSTKPRKPQPQPQQQRRHGRRLSRSAGVQQSCKRFLNALCGCFFLPCSRRAFAGTGRGTELQDEEEGGARTV